MSSSLKTVTFLLLQKLKTPETTAFQGLLVGAIGLEPTTSSV